MVTSNTSYWDKTGSNRIQKFMEDAGISEENISAIVSEMDDIASEIRWEAVEDGRFDESYNHVCVTYDD